VSILLGATAGASAICVHDTGVGMTKQELNQWAVMNLSMEDRGQRPTEKPATGCSQVCVDPSSPYATLCTQRRQAESIETGWVTGASQVCADVLFD
jgi:hypothetical protein